MINDNSFKTFVIFVVLVFAFFIADLATSSVNVCKMLGNLYECKFCYILDLIPTI